MPSKLFEITADQIAIDEVIGRLADPVVGAIATFVGVVRCETDGRQVQYLEYEAYPEMAEHAMQQLADEVRSRWPSSRSAT